MATVPQRRSVSSATQHRTTKALNITLGVEFEFLALESYETGQRPVLNELQRKDYSRFLLSKALEKPVRLTCSSCGEAHALDLPLNVETEQRIGSEPSQWNVVSDTSMHLTELQKATLRSNDCDVYGVELTSRVLSVDQEKETVRSSADSTHVHTVSYQDEITGILKALHEAFNTQVLADGQRRGSHLVTNKSCALHVHVGNQSAGFPLQTVKNLLCICTAFERVIDGMHATTRNGCSTLALTPLNEFSELPDDPNDMAGAGSATDRLVYNKALTERLISNAYVTRRNATYTPQFKTTHVRYPAGHLDDNIILEQAASCFHTEAFVEVIQQAPDIESLQNMLSNCSESSVNILHLIVEPGQMVSEKRPYPRFNTVEFRQHAAVTNSTEALPWIDFLQALVKFAHDQSAEDCRSVCTHAASYPCFDLAEMFTILGVGQQTHEFYLTRSIETVQTAIDDARTEVEHFDVKHPLLATALALLDERAEAHNPEAISKAVSDKFAAGGYGQFTREFIDVYAAHLSEESKEKLTIGWEAPPRPESPLTPDGLSPTIES